MRTPANIAGHPIHPMLVTIPIGLWLFSLVADLIALQSANPDPWRSAAFYTMVGGIIGALAAAIPGLMDLLSLKGRPIQNTALMHMGINLGIVVLYIINAWTRYQGQVSVAVSVLLSVVAIAALLVSGWLGGKMVYLHGVAVDNESADQEAAAGKAPGGWTGHRAAQRGWPASGTRGDHAMASGSQGPGRGTASGAGETGAAGASGAGDRPTRTPES